MAQIYLQYSLYIYKLRVCFPSPVSYQVGNGVLLGSQRYEEYELLSGGHTLRHKRLHSHKTLTLTRLLKKDSSSRDL